jgi:NAD(P)H-dependent FMN reductase
MTKIAIVTGSIRPGRQSRTVADWVKRQADPRGDAQYDVVDIADFHLPVWAEAALPSTGRYEKPTTLHWSAAIGSYDGFVFVHGEYNHSVPGALKNAIDHLSAEWQNKAAGFVSYGSVGGARAVEHLRGVLSQLQVAHVRNQVIMPMATDFPHRQFSPSEASVTGLAAMLDQLIVWTKAMELVRSGELSSGS